MSDSDQIAAMVAHAYDTETFRPALADVRRRVRGRLRRRLPAFLATLALLVGGGGAAVWVAGRSDSWAADCRSQWTVTGRPGPMPPLLLSSDGDPAVRLYGAGPTLFTCVRGSTADGNGESLLDTRYPGRTIDIQDLIDLHHASIVYVGSVPTGTTAITMRFGRPGARTYRTTPRNGRFLIRVPLSVEDLPDPVVMATGSYGLAVVGLPGLHQYSGYIPDTFDQQTCAGTFANLASTAQPPGVDTTLPPMVLSLSQTPGTHPPEAFLYGSARTLMLCTYYETVLFFAQDTPSVGPFTAYGSTDPDDWVVGGRAPAGTTSVQVTMSNGQRAPAVLHDGYWAAAWDVSVLEMDEIYPVAATAVTPSRTYQTGIDR